MILLIGTLLLFLLLAFARCSLRSIWGWAVAPLSDAARLEDDETYLLDKPCYGRENVELPTETIFLDRSVLSLTPFPNS